MALIKCKECGQEISDTATTCPKCGRPAEKGISDEIKKMEKIIESHRSNGWSDIIAGAVILILIGAVLVGSAYMFGSIDTKMTDAQSKIAIAQSGEAKQSASDLLEIVMGFISIIKAGRWIFIVLLGFMSFAALWGGIREWSLAKRINSITGRLKIFNNKMQ